MDNLNLIIGNNLNKYRKNKGLSLDKVAELSGVSKGMLGQIERGETNPSVSTLWKIANGLHVSFTSLLENEPSELVIIKKDNVSPLTESDNKYKIYPVFPFDSNKRFETFLADLEAGCIHTSEAHEKGVEEYIHVSKGSFELQIKDTSYFLMEGDSIRFLADKAHEYKNLSESLTKLYIVINYSEPLRKS